MKKPLLLTTAPLNSTLPNAIAYNNKGISLEALGHKREAEQAYKKARKLGWQEG